MKLFHPTISGRTKTVADADVDAWVASGWRKSEPKASAEARAEESKAAKRGK